MWIPMSETFRQQEQEFRLAFTCEACANFCPVRETCAVVYPTVEHRRSHVDQVPDGEPVRFCKMFEAL